MGSFLFSKRRHVYLPCQISFTGLNTLDKSAAFWGLGELFSVFSVRRSAGHEGTQQRAGVSAAKKTRMVIRPLVSRLLKTTPESAKMSRMWYLEPCVSALCLQILGSPFQESSLRSQGTLMPSLSLFLEVPMCSWRPSVSFCFCVCSAKGSSAPA